MIAIGFGLAAIQLIPTAELFRQGGRAHYSFEAFVSHSLPFRQLLTLLFPLSFGVRESSAMPYFGGVNQIELTGYAGVLPLVLAGLAIAGQAAGQYGTPLSAPLGRPVAIVPAIAPAGASDPWAARLRGMLFRESHVLGTLECHRGAAPAALRAHFAVPVSLGERRLRLRPGSGGGG